MNGAIDLLFATLFTHTGGIARRRARALSLFIVDMQDAKQQADVEVEVRCRIHGRSIVACVHVAMAIGGDGCFVTVLVCRAIVVSG